MGVLVLEFFLLSILGALFLYGLVELLRVAAKKVGLVREIEVGRYCGVCGDWLSDNDERIAARTGREKASIHDACAVALAARSEEE